jgi:hypothetical protein
VIDCFEFVRHLISQIGDVEYFFAANCSWRVSIFRFETCKMFPDRKIELILRRSVTEFAICQESQVKRLPKRFQEIARLFALSVK